MFNVGDKVRFQHMNSEVVDRLNGAVGVVIPLDETPFSQQLANSLLGGTAYRVEYVVDGQTTHGLAREDELTLAEV